MQLYPKLSPENIKRLCNKYLADQVNNGQMKFLSGNVFIKLNYHAENEYYPVGKIYGEITEDKVHGFVDFFNARMEGRL